MKTLLTAIVMVLALTAGASLCRAQNPALHFDGYNGRVIVAGSEGMNPPGPFTMEAWIYPERYPAPSGEPLQVLYKWSAGGFPNQRSFYLGVSQNGRVGGQVSHTGRYAEGKYFGTAGSVGLNQWSHVALVFDGLNLSYFVNGAKDANTATWNRTLFAGTAPVVVGGTYGGTYQPFDGKIDEVRISNIARYAGNFPLPSVEFAPDAHTMLLLHMNEGSGSSTANAGTIGADGELRGGVSWTQGAPITPEVVTLLSISANVLDSAFTPVGGQHGNGLLSISDAAEVVVESTSGLSTYSGGSFQMTASLFADGSGGGIASGEFRGGQLRVADSDTDDMLTGNLMRLELEEIFDGAGLLGGNGLFEVTGGYLADAFGEAFGDIVQITFDLDPTDIDDFSAGFTGLSNITLSPIPEPATAGLLAAGGALVLLRRRRGQGRGL